MPSPASTLCFTCGLAITTPLGLNRLPDGAPCPACHDRLLVSLPPLLPSEPATARVHESARAAEGDEGVQDWPTPPGEERL